MKKIRVRPHNRRLRSGKIVRVRGHSKRTSTKIYISPKDRRYMTERLGRDFTEEEMDEIMKQVQNQADIDILSSKTIKYIQERRNEKKEKSIQRPPTRQELESTDKQYETFEPPIEKRKMGDQIERIHWLEYREKR